MDDDILLQLLEGHYAFNVCDLADFKRKYPIICDHMVLPILDPNSDLDCEPGRIDGMSIRVRSDVPHARLRGVYTILRKGLGRLPPQHPNKLRIYRSKTGRGGWKRV